ncbi:transcriptional regulator with XRE-family HTH domain [Paucibacter oligotrophus]|uniref:Transcriptional regulator with XRE-family HTH domain n=1 Tax=Roseateles oligotrophus TaxID=1769250 RepID=A0A840L5W0_9BURK|nr:helix-turn-helix transcriptional regulator [Roseateles oligotrophus]MBB4843181.1 transcriptional regulator with XRE-family HTH domain [Roseateles oligotrophus]
MPSTKPQLTTREVFARNLRRARRLKDLTQESLALDAGVPRAYLSRVERGGINLSIDSADSLARAIGIPLHELVDPAKFQGLD